MSTNPFIVAKLEIEHKTLPVRLDSCNEKLRTIRIRPRIHHGHDTCRYRVKIFVICVHVLVGGVYAEPHH